MRAIAAYLTLYFALVIGAVLALWQGGVLQRLPRAPVILVLVVAVGFGALLALTSRPPRRPDEEPAAGD